MAGATTGVEVGDRFLYRGDIYEVTAEEGTMATLTTSGPATTIYRSKQTLLYSRAWVPVQS